MSSIVKTGVILKMTNEPRRGYLYQEAMPQQDLYKLETVYGDLHVVSACCVLYYPRIQIAWGTTHGWIDLYDPHMQNFQRNGQDQHVLVLPAFRVRMRRGAMHPIDLEKFHNAGGIVDETPGEMG